MTARKKPRVYPTPPAWMVVGALVDYSAILDEPPTLCGTRIRSEPWQLGHGQWVVAIEGKAGGVLIEALRQSTAVTAATITDEQIRRMHNGYRDGTANDALGRHLCRVALAELCINDDMPGSLRYPTPEEIREAKESLAVVYNARPGGSQ